MNWITSMFIVILLAGIALVGVGAAGLNYIFAVIIPYIAIATFIIGMVARVIYWSRSPVPFRIPTTCGQEKSLAWVKNNNLDNPHTLWGVIGRMFLEIFFFRSLFRNTKMTLKNNGKLVYGANQWLWLAGLAFHYSFLIIFLRHFKFFAEPVPQWVSALQFMDGFFQIGVPSLLLTDLIILGALTYLFLRRVVLPQIRYISMPGDFFPLFLIGGIVTSGICMRHFSKVDIVGVKEIGTGLLSFNPVVPDGIGVVFYIHFFLVMTLIAYFPFSKLIHMGGVFMSPTRNLANNNRARRHVNPWNYPVKTHSYEEWEDEFRDVMAEAGMPLEKQPQASAADEAAEKEE